MSPFAANYILDLQGCVGPFAGSTSVPFLLKAQNGQIHYRLSNNSKELSRVLPEPVVAAATNSENEGQFEAETHNCLIMILGLSFINARFQPLQSRFCRNRNLAELSSVYYLPCGRIRSEDPDL